jgi:hypothetical protein
MKQLFIQIIILIIFSSCNHLSNTERDLRNNLNTILKLDMFKTVQQGNILMSFEEFRQKFKYISVVYLEDGCRPCYPKFIEWQSKMDSIMLSNEYTVLFVIQGRTYSEFITKVMDIDSIEDKYYTIMDQDYTYLRNNSNVPKWIIESSVLIDTKNKIKMVGAPWFTKDLMELFFKICQ